MILGLWLLLSICWWSFWITRDHATSKVLTFGWEDITDFILVGIFINILISIIYGVIIIMYCD